MNVLKGAAFISLYYLLAAISVVAALYIAANLFLLFSQWLGWLLRLLGL